jgi:hypothetical protein
MAKERRVRRKADSENANTSHVSGDVQKVNIPVYIDNEPNR